MKFLKKILSKDRYEKLELYILSFKQNIRFARHGFFETCAFCGIDTYYCKNCDCWTDEFWGVCMGHHIYTEVPDIDNKGEMTNEGHWCLMPRGTCNCVGYDPATLFTEENSFVFPHLKEYGDYRGVL